MPEPTPRTDQRTNTLLLGLFILFLFSSPLLAWWASAGSVWYLPYLLWLGIIALIAWVHRHHHEP